MNLSKSKVNRYALLRHKKYREREGLFLVQGAKAVKDTVGKFEPETFIVRNGCNFDFLRGFENVVEANEADFRKISTLENMPEIIAVYKFPENKDNTLEVRNDSFVLVLDGVQDPGNLGTIVRTAHWFGVNRIFCSKDTVDLFNPKVVLSTMGSIANVDVTYCNLPELFDVNPNLPVYALLLEGENLFEVSSLPAGFIVMGSEGHGPSETTLGYVTKALTIPAAHPDNSPDSLNVAVATAITLSQFIK